MYKQLTSEQRYAINILLHQGKKKSFIAKTIGVSNSTVTRELARNGSRHGHYRWDWAQSYAMRRRARSLGNRSVSKQVKDIARRRVAEDQWSPRQISGALSKEGLHISHETIYKIIREDRRNGGTLYLSCRHAMRHRKKTVVRRTPIPGRIGIEQRPPEADGTRFGDFEMDTIVGRNNKDVILTVLERKTNMLFASKLVHGKNARELAKEVVSMLSPYKSLIRTITTDNGVEFSAHQYITKELGARVYFADPYSSWQKGAIENANGLIRQYIPKKTEFKYISYNYLCRICRKLNSRPREKLNFFTPRFCFLKLID
jgi:IS30 family transposase